MFGDRMWDGADRAWLRRALDERLGAAFGTNCAALFEATEGEASGGVAGRTAGEKGPREKGATPAAAARSAEERCAQARTACTRPRTHGPPPKTRSRRPT